MKIKLIAKLLAVFLCLGGVNSSHANNYIGSKAYSLIKNNDNKNIGKAVFTQGNEGVLIELEISDIKPGKHGMHFHKVGLCEEHKNFKTAEGHIAKDDKPHGFLNESGPHSGNLPNLIVSKGGTAQVELYTQLVSLYNNPDLPNLLDENGSTIVIHENEDDHKTQPIGGAGARIGCGVIKDDVRSVVKF